MIEHQHVDAMMLPSASREAPDGGVGGDDSSVDTRSPMPQLGQGWMATPTKPLFELVQSMAADGGGGKDGSVDASATVGAGWADVGWRRQASV